MNVEQLLMQVINLIRTWAKRIAMARPGVSRLVEMWNRLEAKCLEQAA